MPEIVVGLQLVPDFGVGAEGGGEGQRHIGGDAGLAVEDAGERGAGDLQMPCGRGYVDLAQKLANDFAGVRRIVHTHGVSPGGHPVFRQGLRSFPS